MSVEDERKKLKDFGFHAATKEKLCVLGEQTTTRISTCFYEKQILSILTYTSGYFYFQSLLDYVCRRLAYDSPGADTYSNVQVCISYLSPFVTQCQIKKNRFP